MNLYTLNGRKFTNKTEMYYHLKSEIPLPDYFSDKLDGLWDILSECTTDTVIEIIHAQSIIDNLGDYGRHFLNLLDNLDNDLSNYHIHYY